jgi:hypothetical protein
MEAATSKARAALKSALPMRFGDRVGPLAESLSSGLLNGSVESTYPLRVLCDAVRRALTTLR